MRKQNEEKKKVPMVKDLAVPASKAKDLKGGNDEIIEFPTRSSASKRKR